MNINESPSNGIRHLGFSECGHVLSPQYVLLAKGTFECTIYISNISKMADVDGEFVTVLLQINLAIRTEFFFFELYIYCTIHKSRIKQRALVANVATNFQILIANTENLGALATVSGAISCPASC